MRFMQAAGNTSISKEQLISSELMVLKTLNFSLSTTNPLTYVETLLEVLCESLSLSLSLFISQSIYLYVYISTNNLGNIQ